MFNRMEHERKRIIKSIISLTYFMRGGISYESMFKRCLIERELIAEFIEDRLEKEGKKMYPIY